MQLVRANVSRKSGTWQHDDFDVFAAAVGRAQFTFDGSRLLAQNPGTTYLSGLTSTEDSIELFHRVSSNWFVPMYTLLSILFVGLTPCLLGTIWLIWRSECIDKRRAGLRNLSKQIIDNKD
jgi:hypothetical protein